MSASQLLLLLVCINLPIAIWMGISRYPDALVDTIAQFIT